MYVNVAIACWENSVPGNVVCNCNFVICTIKYTHLCIRHGVQTSAKYMFIALVIFTSVVRIWSCEDLLRLSIWIIFKNFNSWTCIKIICNVFVSTDININIFNLTDLYLLVFKLKLTTWYVQRLEIKFRCLKFILAITHFRRALACFFLQN
jgi:hypothetical protein